MSDPRLTEERLRSWLDANQPQRERLCLHLLPLLGAYTCVTPRRPKGGPDGARDIQAIFDGTLEIWGAVGFQNSADDSAKNKTWIKKKFQDDLKAALGTNSTLKGFLFFTNIDMTPKEQSELTTIAAQSGIEHTQIFYRERLRQMLDSSAGWGYRLQYLAIPMSLEEQITFIDKLQMAREKELAELNVRQEEIGKQIQRLEFLNECLRPVLDMITVIKLKRAFTASELGHFRVAIQVVREEDGLPVGTSIFVGGRDSYCVAQQNGKDTKVFGTKTLAWTTKPDNILYQTIWGIATQTKIIKFRAPMFHRGPFTLVGDFDKTKFDIFLTEPLLDQVDMIAFIVNNYVLLEVSRPAIAIAEEVGLSEQNDPLEMPELLSVEERNIRCRRLFLRCRDTDDTRRWPSQRHAARRIDFNNWTPYRIAWSAQQE